MPVLYLEALFHITFAVCIKPKRIAYIQSRVSRWKSFEAFKRVSCLEEQDLCLCVEQLISAFRPRKLVLLKCDSELKFRNWLITLIALLIFMAFLLFWCCLIDLLIFFPRYIKQNRSFGQDVPWMVAGGKD